MTSLNDAETSSMSTVDCNEIETKIAAAATNGTAVQCTTTSPSVAANNKTATKIPTPLAVNPTTTITPEPGTLPNKCKSRVPFQRSASMRVRGTKSNLISHNKTENFIEQEQFKNNNNITNSDGRNTPNNGITNKKANFLVTHDLSLTGGFSQRRKLNLIPSKPLIQRTHSGHQLCLLNTTKNTTTTTTNITLPLRSEDLKIGHDTTTTNVGEPVQNQNQNALQSTVITSTSASPLCSTFALKNNQINCENLNANNMADNAAESTKTSPMTASTMPLTSMSESNAGQCLQTRNMMSLNLNGSIEANTDDNVSIEPAKGNILDAVTTKVSTIKSANSPPAVVAGHTQKLCNHHHNHQQHTASLTRTITASTIHTKIPSTKLTTVPETKLSPKTPPVTPDSPSTYLDDDLDSMYSFATTTSGRSTMSCEHPYVARNGTTFSGRKMKYVVHCSNYAGQVGADYLTPTQRAQRQIKRLKELLFIARHDLEQKDSEILRLTREVVELRLFKASLSSPEERSASSDAVTVREAELKTSQDVSPIVDMVDESAHKSTSPRHLARLQQQNQQHQQLAQQQLQMNSEMQSSFADSGHFEDITTSSVHSKDSYAAPHMHDIACGSDDTTTSPTGSNQASGNSLENYELQRQEIIRMYEQRIEELIRTQDTATSDMKRTHNDKVEALLQKLAECNTRYADIVPDYEHAKERIRELEKQLEDLQRRLIEQEEKQNKMYLHMYQQGQEAERIARADQALELAHRTPNSKVSINELLHQLQNTQDELENIRAAECRMNECGSNHALLTAKEAISLWVLGARKTIYRRLLEAQKNRTHVDPEVTLQFLKSAVYYFLTDKENSQGHLQAIESILEFTEAEKQNINKARAPK